MVVIGKMAGIALKILFISIVIIFLELLLAPILPEGGIMLQGERYTLLSLIIRLFDILVTFLILIVHLITHIMQVDVAAKDIQLLVDGIAACIFWVVGSFFDIIMHLVALPFMLIGLLIPDRGLAVDFDFLNLDVIGVYVNFETLTFQINISPLPYAGKDNLGWDISSYFNLWFMKPLGLPLLPKSGFFVRMNNVISFSFLPTKDGLDIFGYSISPYAIHENGLGIVVEMMDFIATKPAVVGLIEIGVNTASLGIREISLTWILNTIISNLGIITPVKWMENVYSWVIPSPVISQTIIQLIEILKYKLEKVVHL